MQSTRKPFFTGSVVGVGLGRFVFATATLTAMASGALAGPEGAQVVRGNATINQAGAITTIQAGNNAIINYQRFNIGTGETVRFVQPNATSRVLNRVTGGDPTQINGSLFSNGIVYISNPSGIFFGGRAIVSVGGLTAAAGTITNDDFLRGNDRFTGVSGAVVNNGTIEAGLGGSVNLIGQYVSNHGNIVVEAGTVTMTAGDEVYVGRRDGGLMVRVSKTTAAGDRAGVENSGSIRAAASMLTAGDMYSLAIKNTGTIRSKSVTLEGKGSGVVHVAGTIDARGGAGGGAGERGGDVTITGEKVGLFGATIDASGATGGDVRIGGDYQGRGDLRRADATYVSADSSIRADGGAGSAAAGAGGRVILWSEDYTNFMGTISARGGAQGGHGGFAEVSSRQVLAFRGTADLRADRGNAGMLLLDPNNLTIQAAGATTNVSNTAGVFETTADSAILTVSDLVTQLGLSAVTVQTADQVGSTEAGNITVADAITAPANSNSLTLLAHNDILLNADIDFSASTGDVVLRADGVSSNGVGRIDASGGGTIIMGGGGLALTAGSGVGSAAAPVTTTDVTTLAGASATGGVFVSETNSPGMTIGTVAGTSGLASTTSGNIQIVSSAGLITIAQPVSSAGQLLFQAANGVTFNANASSAGIFRVFADSDTNGAGTLVVADGVTLTSGLEFTGDAGDVNLNATGAITVTGLTSNLLLRPSMPTLTIGLGGAAGDFNLVGTELDSLTPGTSGQVDIGFAASVGGNATINSFTFPFSLVVRGDNVEVAAAQTLTLSGSARRLTLIGADIDLNGGIAAGANEVVMRAPGAADAMDLGVGAPTATFILTNADLNNITSSGNVRIGLGASTGSGAVTIGTVALAGGSAYSLDVRGGATTIGSLTTQNNATINASTGDVTVGSISSGASSVSVTSVAGSILDNAVDNSADVTTTGAVTLAAATAIGGAGSTIDLDVGTVALASATTGGVFLSLLDGNSSGVAITSVAAGNTVLINSPGGVAGAFTITSVSSGAGSTTITNSGNVVLGTIGAAGQAVSVTSTAGSIIDDGTQGTRVTAGTATFTANAGAVGATGNGDIDTDTSTSVAATSGAGGVFIREANSLTIAGLTTTNNGNAFLATDAGDIGQSAAVTVAGVTTFNAAGGLADVLFGTQINSFGAVGGVQVTARDGFVRGSGGVRIGTSNVTRDLTVTATTGNITDNGVVTVGR
ncbi:MAG: beta strand repeat-containing protein, partial [Phycisphaerales bacterium]